MPRTVLIAVLMTVLWTMTEAAEPAITCGATLGVVDDYTGLIQPSSYTLTADLTCPEGVPGLTLLSYVTLDLGGYTLSVAGGVLLYVDNITVRNGTVADCSAAGWCLYNDLYPIVLGDEGHNNLLHDLTLERGVMLLGDGHQAARMHVGAPGFSVDGHKGHFDRIDVRSTSSAASIILYGNRSWLTRSRVQRPVDVPSLYPWSLAVYVDGSSNVVAGVTIEGAQVGISVNNLELDLPNVIIGVHSTDAALADAEDGASTWYDRGGCTNNLWLFNTFATADPPCLLEWPQTIPAWYPR